MGPGGHWALSGVGGAGLSLRPKDPPGAWDGGQRQRVLGRRGTAAHRGRRNKLPWACDRAGQPEKLSAICWEGPPQAPSPSPPGQSGLAPEHRRVPLDQHLHGPRGPRADPMQPHPCPACFSKSSSGGVGTGPGRGTQALGTGWGEMCFSRSPHPSHSWRKVPEARKRGPARCLAQEARVRGVKRRGTGLWRAALSPASSGLGGGAASQPRGSCQEPSRCRRWLAAALQSPAHGAAPSRRPLVPAPRSRIYTRNKVALSGPSAPQGAALGGVGLEAELLRGSLRAWGSHLAGLILCSPPGAAGGSRP